MAGGGSKGEAKEGGWQSFANTVIFLTSNIGHLDKAIDFYQEHVLHDGDQKRESALEQGGYSMIQYYLMLTLSIPSS